MGSANIVNEKNSQYDLVFTDGKNEYTPKATLAANGKDLVLSFDVTYYMDIEVNEDGWVDNESNVIKANNYRLYLAKTGDVGEVKGKYLFQMTPEYDTTNKYYVYSTLTKDDFDTNGKVKEQSISGLKYTVKGVYREVNGIRTDITSTFKDIKDVDAAYTYDERLFNNQNADIILKDYAKQGTVTINSKTNLADATYTTVNPTGSRLNERFASTSADEKINLGTGKDEVVFRGNYGNDTLIANKGEKLTLNFGGNQVKYAIEGYNVKLSRDIKYYVTADIAAKTGSAEGTKPSIDGHTFEAGTQTFTLRQYDVPGDESLKGNYMWASDYSYNTADGKPVYIYLDNSDFAKTDAWDFDGMNISNVKVFKEVNGVTEDITNDYKDAIQYIKDYSYNKDLFNDQISGSVTIANYAKKDPKADITISLYGELDDQTFDITTAKGSRLNEKFISTSADEKINLGTSIGTGRDEVVFSGNYGNDTLIANKGEKLKLYFGDNDVKYAIEGNNVKLSTDVKYYMDVTVNEDGWVDKEDQIVNAGDYKMYLQKVGTVGVDAGKYEFRMDPAYNTTDSYHVYAYLTKDDFNEDGTIKEQSISGLKFNVNGVYKEVNGVVDEETGNITESFRGLNQDDAYAYNETLFNEQTSGSLTIANYAKKDPKADITVNWEKLDDQTFDIATAKGSRLNEKFTSTAKNEKINLGTGKDTVIFKGDYGKDTVVANKGETLNFTIQTNKGEAVNNNNIQYTVKGNDLVLTTDVKYYMDVTVKENGWVDDKKNVVKAGNYKMYLQKVGTVGVDAGKYEFRMDPAYNKKDSYHVYAYLTKDDFNADGTIKEQAISGLKFTVNGVYSEINGAVTEITDTFKTLTQAEAYNKNEELYGKQTEGTITVKNFAGKDTGAALTVNGTDINDVQAIVDMGTKTEADIVKGQIKGTALNDKVNVMDYVSANGVNGVTINTGYGDDSIIGSYYNDTIRANGNAAIFEVAGSNRITTGKGDDVVIAEGYSSNTINVGAGKNTINLHSVGTNRVTAGNDANTVNITNGYNNVKLGNGDNEITVENGLNTIRAGRGKNTIDLKDGANNVVTNKGNDIVTIVSGSNVVNTGAGDDTITVSSGLNNINAGAGIDTITLNGGYNTVNAGNGGKGADKKMHGNTINITHIDKHTPSVNNVTSGKNDDIITVSGGINTLNAGAGNDTYKFTGTIEAGNTITDSKGNDVYDFSGVTQWNDNIVSITDTNGKNSFVLDELKDFYFDVSIKTNKKGDITKVSNGNRVFFSADGWTADGSNQILGAGIDVVKGRRNVSEIKVGTDTYTLKDSAIDQISQNVAGWLNDNGYKSSDAVFQSGKADDVNTLLQMYANTGSADATGALIKN